MDVDPKEALDHYNIRYKVKDNNAIVTCPYHDDTNPSGKVDLSTGIFSCFACSPNKYVHVTRYLSFKFKISIRSVLNAINENSPISDKKLVDPANIERWHSLLMLESDESTKLRNELYSRAVTDEVIRTYRLGRSGSRITIPILNERGDIVQVRYYSPGAKENKFKNSSGKYKTVYLTPIEQTLFNTIVIFGGELKAYASIKELNERDIGCVSSIGGEGSWNVKLNSHFENKDVYICYDGDEAGKKGAERVCLILRRTAQSLHIVDIPYEGEDDVSDYLFKGGKIFPHIESATKWEIVPDSTAPRLDETPIATTLTKAVSAEYAEKRIEFSAVISSLDQSPYAIPKKVKILCNKDQDDLCSQCPVMTNSEAYTIPPESKEIVEMVGESERGQLEVIKKNIGIPKKCKALDFKNVEHYNVEDARISEDLNLTNRSSDRSMQIAYCVGETVEMNECYKMVGRMWPHPKTQYATLLISKCEATQDALATYELKDIDRLKVFQPKLWSVDSIQEKLDEIYTDLAANVTFIFDRPDLHLAVDLAYHSPLFMTFDNQQEKGWVEVLIVGDTAQGKSWVSKHLCNHYGLGERVDCDGATEAGLKGGVKSYGDKWMIEWGKIPENDRRLVILEEIKNMREEVFSALKDMRTEGVAQISKVRKGRSHARTRLIVISNPRSNMNISGYSYGIDSILELIGAPESIRRFDMCMTVAAEEIKNSEALSTFRPKVEHVYNSDICRELVLWAWTVDSVTFESEEAVFKATNRLCNKYTDIKIPIVDRGSMRHKLARLSAALAARTFSMFEGSLLVRECHVKFVERYLDRLYSSEYFGYDQYSKAAESEEIVVDSKALHARFCNTKFSKELAEQLLMTKEVDVFFIQDVMGYDNNTARELFSFLLRNRALKRVKRYYQKTKSFSSLLKKWLAEDSIGPPKYVNTKEDF
jgi:hypothetical protein